VARFEAIRADRDRTFDDVQRALLVVGGELELRAGRERDVA